MGYFKSSWSVSLEAFKMYYVMRASAPSLHRESTDSLMYLLHTLILILLYSPDALTVTVVSTSTTSLTISWTLADDVVATEYTISYSNTDCPNDIIYDDITGISDSETMYTLDDLEEGTEYSITVTAILSDDGGSAPTTVTATTMSVG